MWIRVCIFVRERYVPIDRRHSMRLYGLVSRILSQALCGICIREFRAVLVWNEFTNSDHRLWLSDLAIRENNFHTEWNPKWISSPLRHTITASSSHHQPRKLKTKKRHKNRSQTTRQISFLSSFFLLSSHLLFVLLCLICFVFFIIRYLSIYLQCREHTPCSFVRIVPFSFCATLKCGYVCRKVICTLCLIRITTHRDSNFNSEFWRSNGMRFKFTKLYFLLMSLPAQATHTCMRCYVAYMVRLTCAVAFVHILQCVVWVRRERASPKEWLRQLSAPRCFNYVFATPFVHEINYIYSKILTQYTYSISKLMARFKAALKWFHWP